MVDRILCLLIRESKIAVLITGTAVLMLCPAASAQRRWDAPRVVTWNCSGCHGIDGNAPLPYIARLAGLNATYAERRIAEFGAAASPPVDELFYRVGGRDAPKAGASRFQARVNMNGMAHSITPEEAKASAEWVRGPDTGTGAEYLHRAKVTPVARAGRMWNIYDRDVS